MPELTLLMWHVLPGETDDLGQRGVVRLNLCGNVSTLDKRRAEEYKSIRWARDVVFRFFLPVSWLPWRCAIWGRWEKGLCALFEGLLRERTRGDGRSKGDLVRGRERLYSVCPCKLETCVAISVVHGDGWGRRGPLTICVLLLL